MNLSGKKVIVVGTGISGIGAVKLLCEVGAQAVLYDGNDKLDKAEIESRLPEGAEADIVLGTMEDSLLDSADLAVISPGVPIDSPVVVCLLYTSPSPRDGLLSRMPSSA